MSTNDLDHDQHYQLGYLRELEKQTAIVESKSLQSTSRALFRLQQAEEIACSSMTLLQQQSESLCKIERNTRKTDEKLESANEQVDKLTALNRFFMLPVFSNRKPFKNPFRKEKQEKSVRKQEPIPLTACKEANQESENSIDGNLNRMSSHISRLKLMGLEFGKELNSQNQRLQELNSSMDDTKTKMSKINRKVNRLLD